MVVGKSWDWIESGEHLVPVSREQIWRANGYFHGRTEGVLGKRRVTDEQQRLKEREKKRKENRAGLCQDLAGGRRIDEIA
jgi:hypothetical protein